MSGKIKFPVVSFIAVCYNHAPYVEETLDSIKNQSYKNIELIIVDSNSVDNSVEVIQGWIDRNRFDCAFIRQTMPRNMCQNLNEGLAIASGEYYQGLSCDDVLKPDKVLLQVQEFVKDNSLGLIYSDVEVIDESSNVIVDSFLKKFNNRQTPQGDDVFVRLLSGNFIPAMSVLSRTSFYKEIGMYDESLWYEDWDMWLRLSQRYQVKYLPIISASYRRLESSLFRTRSIKYYRSKYHILNKYNSLLEFRHLLKKQYYLIIKSVNRVENKDGFLLLFKCLFRSENKWSAMMMIVKTVGRSMLS